MHSGAVTASGKLYMWGNNKDCRLFKAVNIYHKSGRPRNYAYPQICDVFEGDHKFIQVSCGTSHSIALTTEGYVFTSGSNEFGQLGVQEYNYIDEYPNKRPYI